MTSYKFEMQTLFQAIVWNIHISIYTDNNIINIYVYRTFAVLKKMQSNPLYTRYIL